MFIIYLGYFIIYNKNYNVYLRNFISLSLFSNSDTSDIHNICINSSCKMAYIFKK